MKSLYVIVSIVGIVWGSIGFSQEEKEKPKKGPDPAALKAFEEKARKQMAERLVKEAEENAAGKGAGLSPAVHVIVEMIEVEHDDFSDWIQENPLTTDATGLRTAVQGWVKGKQAKIRETIVVCARSGQRAKAEAITEIIYPTEYDPGAIPGTVTLDGGSVAPVTAPNPTAFETRNTGVTLEVDPVIGKDGTIDLNLAPELIFHIEDRAIQTTVSDVEQIVMEPTFHACKITTQVQVVSGGYAFIGTSRLPETERGEQFDDSLLLMFVRADAM